MNAIPWILSVNINYLEENHNQHHSRHLQLPLIKYYTSKILVK